MIQQINKDLKKIESWCCYNSLLVNPKKTKLLVFGTRQMLQRLPADFHATLLGKKVTPSPSAWDLGLQVHSCPIHPHCNDPLMANSVRSIRTGR